jgi:K+-transporting ATPase ATPase B chain
MRPDSRKSPAKRSLKKQQLGRNVYRQAVIDAFVKLNPRRMVRNPVMFVVEVGSILTTALCIEALFGQGEASPGFIGAISLWLWFTVLFANFSEALAEGRGKAQADALSRNTELNIGECLPACSTRVIFSWWKPVILSQPMAK